MTRESGEPLDGPGEPETRSPKSGGPLLSVEDLTVELPLGGVLFPAIRGVSFALEAGEAVAVVGESGCGKTQLSRAILGLSPDGARVSGRVALEGRELSRLSDREWRSVRGAGIAMVFQEPAAALDPVQTIGSQVAEAIRLHSSESRAGVRRAARAALQEVAFPDPDRGLDEYPHRLSGGLRQRACLAIALAARPKVLLADEPTASLDSTVAAQILDLLDGLRASRGLAVLLITHDLGIVARHCDRVLVLYAGRIVEETTTAGIFGAAAHPYTRGLLRSAPRLVFPRQGAGTRYETIPGALGDLSARAASGCAFAPRCPERFEPCDRREPELLAAGEGRARCFLYERAPGAPS